MKENRNILFYKQIITAVQCQKKIIKQTNNTERKKNTDKDKQRALFFRSLNGSN